MHTTAIIFKNREDAGQKLAHVLSHYSTEKPIILGMPRGGVVVAYEVAKALIAPLDVIVARKIGAPFQPEYAIGAIAPLDIRIFNVAAISSLDINTIEIETIVAREKKEMERRIKLYRGDKAPLDLKNKLVIIIDDGVATGLSAIAAIRSVRKMSPRKIVFACGVCAQDALTSLRLEADEVIGLSLPQELDAVGQWFQNFEQTTDEEVIRLLNQVS